MQITLSYANSTVLFIRFKSSKTETCGLVGTANSFLTKIVNRWVTKLNVVIMMCHESWRQLSQCPLGIADKVEVGVTNTYTWTLTILLSHWHYFGYRRINNVHNNLLKKIVWNLGKARPKLLLVVFSVNVHTLLFIAHFAFSFAHALQLLREEQRKT